MKSKIITSMEKYDVVIVEQFVTDCGLAIAYKLNAPTVGMTAHILMPWTYSRLGAPNNPAFVPNHMFATGTSPSFWKKVQSALINLAVNTYYTHVIQKSDQEIVNEVYPDVPNLESLGHNISLMLLNQYFPLTGSRLYGSNVIEVGGMHIKPDNKVVDEELNSYLDSGKSDIVYISFGTVASNFPPQIISEIMSFIENSNMKFIWKTDSVEDQKMKNLMIRKWLPQALILCHPSVVAFVTHLGMLSTSEAIHCGVPIIGVPLFGDQFSNAQSSTDIGLGVALDVYTLNKEMLEEALQIVLQDRFQVRAKELSKLWRDRPMNGMDTAVFWIEFVARHQGRIDMTPPTVKLNIIQYLNVDLCLVLSLTGIVLFYLIKKTTRHALDLFKTKSDDKNLKFKKNRSKKKCR